MIILRGNGRRPVRRLDAAELRGLVTNPAATERFWLPIRLLAGRTKVLQQPYANHAWVYAAVSRKATNIQGVPFRIMVASVRDETDQGTPITDDGNPWVRLFARPNPSMSGADLFGATSVHLDLDGEALWLLTNTPSGGYDPRTPPSQVWIVQSPRGLEPRYQGQVLLGWRGVVDGREVAYPAEQVIQFREYSPYGVRGLAPMDAALKGATLDWKASMFQEAYLDNGADPGGILTTDLDLDAEQKRQMRIEWNRRHQGALNRGRIAILEGGLRYEPITVDHAKMQFLGQREWSRDEILAVFGVPKLEVGLIEDVNRNTAQVTRRLFWQNNLIPRLRKIEETLWAFFFRPFNRERPRQVIFGEFDLSDVEALKEDYGEKLEHASQLTKLGYGLNSVNSRLGLGMDEVDWGDEPLEIPNKVPITTLYDQPGQFLPQQQAASASVRRDTRAEAYLRGFFHPAEREVLRGFRAYLGRMRALQVAEVSEWARARATTRDLPPLTEEEIDSFLLGPETWARGMQRHMGPKLGTVALSSLAQLEGEMGGFDEIAPDLDTAWVRQRIARRVAQLVRIARKDRIALRRALLRQFGKTGPSNVREIQAVVAQFFGRQRRGRALTIARTETAMLSNGLRHRAMKAEGVERHEWVTAGDDHVRPANPRQAGNHRRLDGEIRKIGERFGNGLYYPAMPGGRPEEVINCRCVAVPVA